MITSINGPRHRQVEKSYYKIWINCPYIWHKIEAVTFYLFIIVNIFNFFNGTAYQRIKIEYLGTSGLLTIRVVMPWTCEFGTKRWGFTRVWKVLFSPPSRSLSAISMIRSFSLLKPVVSMSKTITVTRLASSLFSAIFCRISQYSIFWNWLISVLFTLNVSLFVNTGL